MTRKELIDHLVPLVQANVLAPRAALEAAFDAGFKEADATNGQRNSLQRLQERAMNQQGQP